VQAAEALEKKGVTEAAASEKGKKNGEKKDSGAGEEDKVVTEHSAVLSGETIDYTVTAGTLVLKKAEEKPHASVFYVAYTKKGVGDPADRPVMFCFNGGPGSSAVWLHLGGLGPKRVEMGDGGTQPAPPYRLIDNPHSVLAVADLVFIDPVSTGYSRPEKGEKAKDCHGFDPDLNSVAEFIRLYTTRNSRWASPKFLAGESYGAFRAAGLASVLQNRFGMYLNGVILVSGLLDFETLRHGDLTHILFLPAMASVAAYHKKLGSAAYQEDPLLAMREAEVFAKGEYATALLKGAGITGDEKEKIAARLAELTGLDTGLITRLNLRVPPSRFREELLRDEGLIIGRFDGRLKASDGDDAGVYPGFDPSYTAVYGAYSAMMKDYVRRELNFESDLVYEILTSKVRPWSYKPFVGSFASVEDKFAKALRDNPHLKTLVVCGP